MGDNFHERLDRPELPLPSNRSTGFVFAAVALVIAFLWRGNTTVLTVALALAAGLTVISIVSPSVLYSLNVAWMRFALTLSKIMNPIVMLVLFAVAIIPAGLIMQLFRDPLRRRKNEGNTFWLSVDQAERSRVSHMKQQF